MASHRTGPGRTPGVLGVVNAAAHIFVVVAVIGLRRGRQMTRHHTLSATTLRPPPSRREVIGPAGEASFAGLRNPGLAGQPAHQHVACDDQHRVAQQMRRVAAEVAQSWPKLGSGSRSAT